MTRAALILVFISMLLQYASAELRLKLDYPRLVGASNDSATHYWFPTDMSVVFNASHFLLGARLADDCSDYFCNHTTTCKPSDPSHQISMSTDGGRHFIHLWKVGGTSPWSAGLQARPFIGPCTVELNATTRLSLYQGKIWAPYKNKAAIFRLDPISGMSWGISKKAVVYNGADSACGSGHLWNQGVIKTANEWLMSAQCDIKSIVNGTETKVAIALIFSSEDGFIWNLRSKVNVSAPIGEKQCTSPGENTIVELSGKRLLLVARCGDNQQLLAWISTNGAVTWQRHRLTQGMFGVMPVAVRMDNGAIVLTTGRGGLALWLNANGDGRDWKLTNVGQAHNKLILQNRDLNGASLQYTSEFVQFEHTGETTAYNTLRKLGDNDGIICYDRTSSSGAIPGKPSCGPPGNRDKNDHLFCMRFSVVGTAEQGNKNIYDE